MYKLFAMPSTAAMAPHILLREIGAPFELVMLDPDRAEHKAPAYLALNPHGRVPTLLDGDLVLYEAAAICLHLADRHPEAGLAPAAGSLERATFYRWLVHLTNTVQAEMLLYFYPHRYVSGDEAEADFKARTEARISSLFTLIDAELAGKPYLLGDHYSALDPYLFMLARWTRFMNRPARDLPNIGPYLARILARVAVQDSFAAEGLGTPYY